MKTSPTQTGPALPPANSAQKAFDVPSNALTQLRLIEGGVETDNDQQIVNSVIEYIKSLISEPETTPFPAIGNRLLGAFRSAEDEGELFTFVKNLWKQIGQPYERHVVKSVARVLAKWYSVIHEQLFGSARELMTEEDMEEPEEDSDEGSDGDEADGDEEAIAKGA